MTDNIGPYAPPDATLHDVSHYAPPSLVSMSVRVGRFRLAARLFAATVLLGLALMLLEVASDLLLVREFAYLWPITRGVSLLLGLIYAMAAVVWFGQRFMDLGASRRWGFLAFLPALNLLVLVFLMVMPGTRADNRFGKPPLPPGAGYKVVFTLTMALVLVVLGSLIYVAIQMSADD
jgi:uncharacterized membrane protein YhaH (DUF805 family)